MAVIPRTAVVPTVLSLVVLPLLVLVGCTPARRIEAPRPAARTCLPPLEGQAPVGTEVAESMSACFVLRVHDVRDLFDLLPVIQLVGPNGIRTVPPEDALVESLLQELDASARAVTTIHATDSGALVVKGPVRVQEEVAGALHRLRVELVRREAFGAPGSPPGHTVPRAPRPFDLPRPPAGSAASATPQAPGAAGALTAEEQAAVETVPPAEPDPADAGDAAGALPPDPRPPAPDAP